MTLTDFLLARIAEDEDAVSEWPTVDAGGPINYPALRARMLAECEAKRRIVEAWKSYDEQGYMLGMTEGGRKDGLGAAIAHLATVYADHPDYRDEWRP